MIAGNRKGGPGVVVVGRQGRCRGYESGRWCSNLGMS